ncbi:ABC transporter ATP-binding protein, partial [Candidatus Falkowbacteria bacterium]|nr:ABC transporter ATP-binding protein [Candidatus Falkowbacteria bacterium]
LVGYAVDHYIVTKQFHGVLVFGAILLLIYILALIASYFQTILMGTVGQNVLFDLRNRLFNKIQSLPIAFFNQNKAGDLISRINNDTDKLNQFLSQGLVQFVANIISIIGAAIFIIVINWRLGLAALVPALLLLFFTRALSPWIKKTNALSLKKTGSLSAEISESIDNFKIIIAFNRRDYFRKRFSIANSENYKSAISAGIANNTLTPTYGLASNAAQLIIIGYGLYLISVGNFSLGLLISFISYVSRLYDPLRQLAQIWSSFQTALAGWDRINSILSLQSDLAMIEDEGSREPSGALLEFKNVFFQYTEGKDILHNINFKLDKGKTYALVGPTGGGKTTTASLMARLYDATKGEVLLDGKNIRTYSPDERVKKIGFILQDPFLFTGTVRDNLLYGNEPYQDCNNSQLEKIIKESGLELLLERFDSGLDTKVNNNGGGLSIGQKQLIAFMRIVLRKPEILILDEATANIDTVTEQLLEHILNNLPAQTTKVIIAHRLNTIKNADEIFFVNDGEIIQAGSMEIAINLLLHGKRKS